MEEPREDFLTGARLALEEHGHPVRGDPTTPLPRGPSPGPGGPGVNRPHPGAVHGLLGGPLAEQAALERLGEATLLAAEAVVGAALEDEVAEGRGAHRWGRAAEELARVEALHHGAGGTGPTG